MTHREPCDTSYRGKRAFDLLMCALLAVPAAAVALPAAACVRVTSPGPALFRQTRVGLGGHEFQILKLRTMRTGTNPVFPDASSITPVGRLLRRTAVDELPQLVNVLKGDMSIVGPRPTLPYQVLRYQERQRGRLRVRPGLTGLAQVAGRNQLPWSDRIEIDLEYVERQSLWLDLTVLARSAVAVLRGSGASGHPTDDPLAVPDPRAADEPA